MVARNKNRSHRLATTEPATQAPSNTQSKPLLRVWPRLTTDGATTGLYGKTDIYICINFYR
jgi:hypothetical protein